MSFNNSLEKKKSILFWTVFILELFSIRATVFQPDGAKVSYLLIRIFLRLLYNNNKKKVKKWIQLLKGTLNENGGELILRDRGDFGMCIVIAESQCKIRSVLFLLHSVGGS